MQTLRFVELSLDQTGCQPLGGRRAAGRRNSYRLAAGVCVASWILLACCIPAWAADPIPGLTPQVGLETAGTQRDGQDWPTFLGADTDSRSTETGFQFPWPTAGLPVVWQRPLGESYGIGSIARGCYYQFDHDATRKRAVLHCLNAATGELRWEFAYRTEYEDMYGYSSGPRTSPLIDDDRVYLFGVEGKLHCLDADTGDEIWNVDTQTQFGVVQNFFGVGSTPCVFQDHLLVMVGGSPAADQSLPAGQLDRVTPNGSAIVALDKRTGKLLYQLGDDLASYASLKLVKSQDRYWCFAFLRGGLLAFEPGSGRQDFYFPWRAKSLESVNASTPVCWGNHVLISETYGPGAVLLRFGKGDPQVVWSDAEKRRDKSLQTHWNTAIYHDGYLYGCSGRHTQTAELRCVAAETGQVMWSQPGLSRLSILYVDQHLISLDEYGTLRVVKADPTQYQLVSEFSPKAETGRDEPLLKYPAWAAPILSHGRLYVRGRDRLVCYQLPKQ